jgi:uncharacterized protein YjiS (DUF1127 family)
MLNSSGSWNGVARRYDVPSRKLRIVLRDNGSATHENRAVSPTLDLADVKSPPAITPAMRRADRQNTGPWPSIFAFLTEGFALYGASYGALQNEIATSPAEANARQPGMSSPCERRQLISIVSPSASPGVTAPERETYRVWLAEPWRAIARRWGRWRRQREIKKAVAALTKLDEKTLRDIGIPHRSQIEKIVRYGRDC